VLVVAVAVYGAATVYTMAAGVAEAAAMNAVAAGMAEAAVRVLGILGVLRIFDVTRGRMLRVIQARAAFGISSVAAAAG